MNESRSHVARALLMWFAKLWPVVQQQPGSPGPVPSWPRWHSGWSLQADCCRELTFTELDKRLATGWSSTTTCCKAVIFGTIMIVMAWHYSAWHCNPPLFANMYWRWRFIRPEGRPYIGYEMLSGWPFAWQAAAVGGMCQACVALFDRDSSQHHITSNDKWLVSFQTCPVELLPYAGSTQCHWICEAFLARPCPAGENRPLHLVVAPCQAIVLWHQLSAADGLHQWQLSKQPLWSTAPQLPWWTWHRSHNTLCMQHYWNTRSAQCVLGSPAGKARVTMPSMAKGAVTGESCRAPNLRIYWLLRKRAEAAPSW